MCAGYLQGTAFITKIDILFAELHNLYITVVHVTYGNKKQSKIENKHNKKKILSCVGYNVCCDKNHLAMCTVQLIAECIETASFNPFVAS